MMVDISGIDKAELLLEMWKAVNEDVNFFSQEEPTKEMMQQLLYQKLAEHPDTQYVSIAFGKTIKMQFAGNNINPQFFESHYKKKGLVQNIVDNLGVPAEPEPPKLV